jgi:hypothetical protein
MTRLLGWKAPLVVGALLLAASTSRAGMMINITATFTHDDAPTAEVRAQREAVVNQAIADWQSRIFAPEGQPVNLRLDIRFTDLGPNQGGGTSNIRPDANGNPGSASIVLNIHTDAVNPAQNYYWNVDPAGLGGNRDGLSITRHELGHALGFAGGSTADLLGYDKWNAAIAAGSTAFNRNGVTATMAGTGAGGRSHLSSTAQPGDLMNTSVGAGRRTDISDLDVRMLSATFGYLPVPEPSSFVLAGLGGFALMGYAWRKRRRAA